MTRAAETDHACGGDDAQRPSLNAAVLHRRADEAFYRRLRAAIRQNQRALEHLAT